MNNELKTVVDAIENKKGINIKILKIDDITIIADYFVIASGTSNTHIKALADEVEFKMEQSGFPINHREGYEEGKWVLLDYNSVIVHIFYPETRDFYSLEKLWSDATEIDINTLR